MIDEWPREAYRDAQGVLFCRPQREFASIYETVGSHRGLGSWEREGRIVVRGTVQADCVTVRVREHLGCLAPPKKKLTLFGERRADGISVLTAAVIIWWWRDWRQEDLERREMRGAARVWICDLREQSKVIIIATSDGRQWMLNFSR